MIAIFGIIVMSELFAILVAMKNSYVSSKP
jgi:hypothetical protein